jgi:bZIP transcription factor
MWYRAHIRSSIVTCTSSSWQNSLFLTIDFPSLSPSKRLLSYPLQSLFFFLLVGKDKPQDSLLSMQQGDREPTPSAVRSPQHIVPQPPGSTTSMMTTATTQSRSSPYLHEHHQYDATVNLVKEDYSAGGDNRATSPTVVVSTNRAKDAVMSPVPTTATSRSLADSPLSTGYSPNPEHYCPRQPSSGNFGTHHVSFHGDSSHHSSSSNLHSGQNQGGAERDPLSPHSAPVVRSAWPSFPAPNDRNPAISAPIAVPSEIHTKNGIGPTPYFPSIKSSGSLSSRTSTTTATSTSKTISVIGKKKHMTKASSVSSISNHGETTTVVTIERGGEPVPARRQKRLERNRESARLSRRRRKQYLEVLEERVAKLSLDMDRGRREHASMAIDVVVSKRHQVLESALGALEDQRQVQNLERSLWLLDGPLSRTSEEFLILSTFFIEQLKSFALPSHSKFVLWLTLQGDTYFRGGRAASERLSAARIGERVSCTLCLMWN